MSKPRFESTGDQFPPHLRVWDEFDLKNWYPELEANSALGKMAVELEQAIETSEAGLKGWDRSSELDRLIYADEITTNETACARRDVFQIIYDDLAGQPIEKDYQTAVLEAQERGMSEAHRMGVPLADRPALALLPQEVCLFLGLEADQHFKKLAR